MMRCPVPLEEFTRITINPNPQPFCIAGDCCERMIPCQRQQMAAEALSGQRLGNVAILPHRDQTKT